jgi:lipopolysaccharide/colanic/teichoic acid biosynthesis glycosyltransferase
VLVVLAIAIRLDSPGPAFFRQERVGLGGATFWIHKFRTLAVSPRGALITPSGDPRVTRVGAFLRRTRLDELPQVFDVLVGHMSLVGPRPEVPRYASLWPAEYRELILSVRPGITDPASVAFRHEADQLAKAEDPEDYYITVILPEKAKMYAEYVQTRNFATDLLILAKTGAAVLNA